MAMFVVERLSIMRSLILVSPHLRPQEIGPVNINDPCTLAPDGTNGECEEQTEADGQEDE